MKLFYDMEAETTITEKQLLEEMKMLIAEGNIEQMDFADYVKECTGKNGTLKAL